MNLGGRHVEGDINVAEAENGGGYHTSLYTCMTLSRIKTKTKTFLKILEAQQNTQVVNYCR